MNNRLHTLLLDKANLSEKDLEQAYNGAEQKNTHFCRMLVRQKLLTEGALLPILAEYFQLELISSLPQCTDTAFTAKIPIGFLKKNLLVPLRINGEPCLAIHDPFEFDAVDEAASILDMRGCPLVLSTEEEIIRTIKKINVAFIFWKVSAEQGQWPMRWPRAMPQVR